MYGEDFDRAREESELLALRRGFPFGLSLSFADEPDFRLPFGSKAELREYGEGGAEISVTLGDPGMGDSCGLSI